MGERCRNPPSYRCDCLTPPCPQSRRLQAAWKQALSHAAWGSTRPVEVLFSERWYSAVPYVRTPHVQMLGCRPMVSNNSAGPIVRMADVKTDGYVDSKTTKEDQRETLFSKLKKADYIAWDVISVSPESLSADMLKKVHASRPARVRRMAMPHQLHGACAGPKKPERDFVRQRDRACETSTGQGPEHHRVVCGHSWQRCDLPTGKCSGARKHSEHSPTRSLAIQMLSSIFPGIKKIVVEAKADGKYPIVGAASICAKVQHGPCTGWALKGRWSGSASSVAAPRGSRAQSARSGWWALHRGRLLCGAERTAGATTKACRQDGALSLACHNAAPRRDGRGVFG